MLTMSLIASVAIIFLMISLLFGVICVGLRLAWGLTKFIFGLGLFWLCPVMFVLIVLLGSFSHLWFPILLVGLFFGRRYRLA